MGRHSLLVAVIFVLSAACAIVFLPGVLVDVTMFRASRQPSALTFSQTLSAITAARQAVLFAVSGVLAVITLLSDGWRNNLTRRSMQLDEGANRTDRFAAAVDQLGSDSIAVRLSGIYSLERIAEDSARDRQTIVNLRAASIRDNSPQPRWSAKRSWVDSTPAGGSGFLVARDAGARRP